MPSADNRADIFIRQSSGLEAALHRDKFLELWSKWGPFQWDLMASAANVRRKPQGDRLKYFPDVLIASPVELTYLPKKWTTFLKFTVFHPYPSLEWLQNAE